MITCNILFSGIGAQEAALKRLGLDFKVVGISEIDKYAIQSYEAINGATRNYGDITKIPFLDYADLWTYSSPCQDFSTAGKQQGIYNADGSLTRSGLLKHVERLLETSVALGNQPKYLLMENVKGLVSKKFKPDFLKWLDKLEQLGYDNYWQVLNAKDYGIPQNRERVFVVSIRKDVDTNGYTFPAPVPLKKRLKDMLEPVVDEKYYLNDEKVKKFIENFREPETSYCIDANYWKGTTVDDYLKKHRRQLIKEVSNTIRCGGGSSLNNKHSWDIIAEPLACASRGQTEPKTVEQYRIRKLTAKECWRLMGFTDVEFECAKLSGVSNSQLYKQAGNSIVVDVLVAIFKELLNDRL